ISTLTPDGSKFDEISANVFGNERHNAIIQVKLRLGDDKGKEIPKNNPISLTAVKRSITLGNYDDTNGFIALGGGAMTGWKVHDSPSVFLCPPQQSEGPLPTISPSIYKDYVDGDNLYCIHFFVSYDESKGSGPG